MIVLLWIGLALICAAPSRSAASGYYVPSNGTQALGSGGAFVAAGIDPTAIWHNPANLVDLGEGRHFAVDVAGVHTLHTFYREPTGFLDLENSRSFDHAPAKNIHGPVFIPTLAGVWDVGDWAVAAGTFSPYQGRFRYDPDGPTRYTFVDNTSFTYYLGGALSWSPSSWLRIGAGAQAVALGLRARFKLLSPFSLLGQDIDATLDSFGIDYTWNAGVTWVPAERFRIAASAQSPVRDRDDINLYLDMPDIANMFGLTIEGDSARFELELPWLLRSGVAYELSEGVWIESAFHVELWSVADSLRLEPTNIVVRIGADEADSSAMTEELATVALPQLLDDAWSIRLGVRYHPPGNRLGWRAGVFYETPSVPTKTYNVGTPDNNRIGLTGGLSYGLGDHWSFELAAAHFLQDDVIVEDSVLRPEAVALGPFETTQVANGRYSAAYNIVIAGLRYRQ
ncbi:MAG: hypothetical protein CME06_02520 [Gemmatimonadetes bacterium]|nr:hypothetical protein [Gemmatimonadota bacterium]